MILRELATVVGMQTSSSRHVETCRGNQSGSQSGNQSGNQSGDQSGDQSGSHLAEVAVPAEDRRADRRRHVEDHVRVEVADEEGHTAILGRAHAILGRARARLGRGRAHCHHSDAIPGQIGGESRVRTAERQRRCRAIKHSIDHAIKQPPAARCDEDAAHKHVESAVESAAEAVKSRVRHAPDSFERFGEGLHQREPICHQAIKQSISHAIKRGAPSARTNLPCARARARARARGGGCQQRSTGCDGKTARTCAKDQRRFTPRFIGWPSGQKGKRAKGFKSRAATEGELDAERDRPEEHVAGEGRRAHAQLLVVTYEAAVADAMVARAHHEARLG
eukprot:3509993-Prymnesium_polylepis.1